MDAYAPWTTYQRGIGKVLKENGAINEYNPMRILKGGTLPFLLPDEAYIGHITPGSSGGSGGPKQKAPFSVSRRAGQW